MKKITFKKGIYKIYFPFMLSDYSPWQEQVREQQEKLQREYKHRKSAYWGFELDNRLHGKIVLYKH